MRGKIAPHIGKKILDKSFLTIIPLLFESFYLVLDKENCQCGLPYSGGVMEQPYFEHEVWRIFLSEYIPYKKEQMEIAMRESKKPSIKVVNR